MKGENLPDHFHDLWAKDRDKVDLLIVMGSSLKVAPVANVKGFKKYSYRRSGSSSCATNLN